MARSLAISEAGGISATLLYGGNAVFYHISLAEYAEVLRGVGRPCGKCQYDGHSIGWTSLLDTMLDQAVSVA
jgi:hypothetical protein